MANDNTRQVDAPGAEAYGHDVLRRLARRALGLSGADIERLVREARQVARRAGRTLAYDDLDSLLSSDRPTLSPERRRRIAVHEAGHTLARILLDVGEVSAISIDGPGGLAFTESIFADDAIDTREGCEAYPATATHPSLQRRKWKPRRERHPVLHTRPCRSPLARSAQSIRRTPSSRKGSGTRRLEPNTPSLP